MNQYIEAIILSFCSGYVKGYIYYVYIYRLQVPVEYDETIELRYLF